MAGERYGRPYLPHELEWLRAVVTLEGLPKRLALRDISDMTGRTQQSLRDRGRRLGAKDRAIAASMKADQAKNSLGMIPGTSFGTRMLEPCKRIGLYGPNFRNQNVVPRMKLAEQVEEA